MPTETHRRRPPPAAAAVRLPAARDRFQTGRARCIAEICRKTNYNGLPGRNCRSACLSIIVDDARTDGSRTITPGSKVRFVRAGFKF